MHPTELQCYHCGETVPAHAEYNIMINGRLQPLCCAGCHAVATLIFNSGLGDFYQFRSRPSSTPKLEADPKWQVYDQTELLDNISHLHADGSRSAVFFLENLYCGACAWLLENTLKKSAGVLRIQVNPTSKRLYLHWKPQPTKLSELLQQCAALGYRPHPLDHNETTTLYQREKRQALKRLAVAGLGMMQVMMYAVALYLGAFDDMDNATRRFLTLISLLVTTPVLLYAGQPFFKGAYNAMRQKRLNMDVPVALALSIAYSASLWSALSGGHEIYFDSVCMFIFFLSLGRYAEMLSQHRMLDSQDALSRTLPALVSRLRNGALETVALKQLRNGDIVIVKPGEAIPADGCVVRGTGHVDEAIISGEAAPKKKSLGDHVIAGSLNGETALHIQLTHTGAQTTLAQIQRLLSEAQAQKPQLAKIADAVAGRFVIGILLIALAVMVYWWYHDPARLFPIVLSVLVVSCPCALSLATPTALSAAIARFAKSGLLITRGDVIESLSRITHFVFDKTGTLTRGQLQLQAIHTYSTPSAEQCTALAAALEQNSHHPIARAFKPTHEYNASAVHYFPGQGMEGEINGQRYRIGQYNFVTADFTSTPSTTPDHNGEGVQFYLADRQQLLARFVCSDPLRPESKTLIAALQEKKFSLSLASGDNSNHVRAIAEQLGIKHYFGSLLPQDKLKYLRKLQQQGAVVAMLGDGINDAPVLAAADIALAIGSGSALAHSHADIILLNERLDIVLEALHIAAHTRRIIRQNLAWALIYNLSAIPLAAAGLIAPWVAAIGMSCSSLFVVLNAMRLQNLRKLQPDTPHHPTFPLHQKPATS